MTKQTLTPEGLKQIYEAALWADNAFQQALEEDFGAAACEMRYAKILPTRHTLLRIAKLEADQKWLAAMRSA